MQEVRSQMPDYRRQITRLRPAKAGLRRGRPFFAFVFVLVIEIIPIHEDEYEDEYEN